MFRFRKVREPEQTDENVSTFEELANRLNEIVQTARKDKSHFNHYVGNESQRVAQIGQTAATIEQTAQRISDFEIILKNIKKEVQSIQTEVKNLQVLKSKTAELFNQFFQLKSQLKATEEQQKSIQKSAEEFNIFLEKADKARAEITLKLNSIDSKQVELLDKYDDFLQRLKEAEDQLGHLSGLQAEFEKTTENVTTESARITIWMAATEKMSEKLKQATELFETTKQKIDRLHELAEYVESKTKTLAKQKELLKNAYIEAGKANAIFWEIKSKYSELEQDAEKIKKMETQTSRFDSELESIEGRVSTFDTSVKKLLLLSEKIEKTDKEVGSLTDELNNLNQRVNGSRKQAVSIAEECADIHKSQENLRLDVSEVMDQFGKLSDLRVLTEEKTRVLSEYLKRAEQGISELSDISVKTTTQAHARLRE